MDPYTATGLCVSTVGGLFALLAYTVMSSVPLTALGIAAVIVGSVLMAIGRGSSVLPSGIEVALHESSLENLSALVEEMGLRVKAIYLPSSLAEGGPLALVPVSSNPGIKVPSSRLPRRFLIRYGPRAEDVGFLISTPGSVVVRDAEVTRGTTLGNLENQLNLILVRRFYLADSVAISEVGDDRLVVELANPRLREKRLLVHEVLGSSLASMAASTAAEVLGRPVVVEEEEERRDKLVLVLRLLGEAS